MSAQRKRLKYCALLDVDIDASQAEIKRAFNRFALRYHPDKNPDTEKKFKEINEAYTYLKNPEPDSDDSEQDVHEDDEEEDDDEEWDTNTDDGELDILLRFHSETPRDYDHHYLYDYFMVFLDVIENYEIFVPLEYILHGLKKKYSLMLSREETVHLQIKPGSNEGTVYRFNSAGKPVEEWQVPIFTLILRMKPHEKFFRKNNDLIYKTEITQREARRRPTLEIPTLDGTTLNLTLDGVTHYHKRIFENYGLPLVDNPKKRGNLVVKINVDKAAIPPLEITLLLKLEEFYRGCVKREKIRVTTTHKNGKKLIENRIMEVCCKPGVFAGTVIQLNVPYLKKDIVEMDPECVWFTIEQIEHPVFVRAKHDLEYTAWIGTDDREVKVPTLDKSFITLPLPEAILDETSLCVFDQGMPHFANPKVRGDILVSIKFAIDNARHEKPPPMVFDVFITLKQLIKGCTKPTIYNKTVVDVFGKKQVLQKTVQVVIKPGMREGSKVTFPSSGHEKPNMIPADVVFVVKLKPNKNFVLRDNDIVHNVKLSKKSANRAAKVDIPLPEGGSCPVELVIPLDRSSYVHCLPKHGLPLEANPNDRGDLLVEFEFSSKKKATLHVDLLLTLEEILLGCSRTVEVPVVLIDSKGRERNSSKEVNILCKPEQIIGQSINQSLSVGVNEKIVPNQVLFTIKALPHEMFVLENNTNNLIFTATARRNENNLEIVTLNNERLFVKVPDSSQEYARIPNRGMFFVQANKKVRGDLLVKFEVKNPEEQDENIETEALKQEAPIRREILVTLEELLNGCTREESIVRKIIDSVDSTVREENRIIIVEIMPGMRDQSEITFTRLGDVKAGFLPADICFTIRVAPNKLFVCEGDDLIYRAMITNEGARTSTEVIIPLLEGGEHILKVSQLKPEQVEEIPGKGLPCVEDPSRRGKLIVKFNICAPKNVPLKYDLFITLENILHGFTKIVPIDTVVIDENRRERTQVQDVKVSSKPGWNGRATLHQTIPGNCVPNTVDFKLDVSPHRIFKMKNVDLFYTVEITAQDREIKIPTLDGDGAVLDLPEIISSNFTRVLKGRGLPNIQSGKKWGDLIVKFEVVSKLKRRIIEEPQDLQVILAPSKPKRPKRKTKKLKAILQAGSTQEVLLFISLEEVLKGSPKKLVTFERKLAARSALEDATVEVSIEPGIEEGTRKTFPGIGDHHPGCHRNDVVFVIHTNLHKSFCRRGQDLHCPVFVAPNERTVQIPMLDGGNLSCSINDRSTWLEFSNLGLPILGSMPRKRGKLVVELFRKVQLF